MHEFYIDLTGIKSKEQLHDLLEQKLPLPDYYGRNLDALYDVLTMVNEPWTISLAGVPAFAARKGGSIAEPEAGAAAETEAVQNTDAAAARIIQGFLQVLKDAALENSMITVRRAAEVKQTEMKQTETAGFDGSMKKEGDCSMKNTEGYIASGGQTWIPFQENIHIDFLPFDPPAKPDPLLPELELTQEAIDKGYVLPSQKQHFLPGLTSEMLDWFWANMEKCYYLWAPGSHKRFNWVKTPVEYGMQDSILMIAETTGKGLPVFGGEGVQIHRLHLTDFYPCKTALKHVICEGVFNDKGEFVDSTIHEWEDVPGGIVHITATVSNTRCSMPPGFVLKMIEEDPNVKIVPNWATEHEDYEASQWPVFLPKLYELWKNHPDPAQNVQCNLEVAIGADGKYHYIAENGPVQIPKE